MEVISNKRVLSPQTTRSEKRMRTSSQQYESDSEQTVELNEPEDEIPDTESVYSVQQRETDFPVDTSDTSLSDSDFTEYEVSQLSPDKPNPFFSTDDSDEMNEINEIAQLGAVVAAVKYNNAVNDSDVGQLADTSTEISTSPTSNSDCDPELPRLDYLDFWTCAQCNAVNGNRHVPFCSKCYQMRKNFFPPRPRRRRLLPKSSTDSGVELGGSQSSSANQDEDVVDGPCRAVDDNVQGPSRVRPSNCPVCLDRPVNGMFTHGSTAHMYCCFKCGKKIWRQSGRCPLCRKKLDRVYRVLQIEK